MGEARRYAANDFLNLIALPMEGGCPKGRGGPVKNDEKPANLIPVLL